MKVIPHTSDPFKLQFNAARKQDYFASFGITHQQVIEGIDGVKAVASTPVLKETNTSDYAQLLEKLTPLFEGGNIKESDEVHIFIVPETNHVWAFRAVGPVVLSELQTGYHRSVASLVVPPLDM